MEKMKFTEETTPQQKLDSLKNVLSQTFAEPQDVQHHWLASEFSTMKQQATEPIDRRKKTPHTSSCRTSSRKQKATYSNTWY